MARFLPCAFVMGMAMGRREQDQKQDDSSRKGIVVVASGGKNNGLDDAALSQACADCAIMAGICCVLWNDDEDGNSIQKSQEDDKTTTTTTSVISQDKSTKRTFWERWREEFLRGIVRSAGRRYACGVEDSGCLSSRAAAAANAKRSRNAAFDDWGSVVVDDHDEGDDDDDTKDESATTTTGGRAEERGAALRPFLTIFGILDDLNREYRLDMDDKTIEESVEKIVSKVERCSKARTVMDLLKYCRMDDVVSLEDITTEFERGRKGL